MSKLRIYLTNLGKYNEGELVGEWVDLPISEDELEQVYSRIGISDKPDAYGNYYEETFITDYESDIDGLYIGEYDSVSELNELAEILESWSDYTVSMFEAACEAGEANIEDIKDFDPDEYYFVTDVSNDEELGQYFIDEVYGGIDRLAEDERNAIAKHRMDPDNSIIRRYYDFDAYGREFADDFNIDNWIDTSDEDAVQQALETYDVDDIYDIDAYTYFGAVSDSDLGIILTEGMPSDDGYYFDYESYGRDTRLAEGGSYVSNGYISKIR